MPAEPRIRRNWAGLIAVPVVAVVLLSCAQVAAWPRPAPRYEAGNYDLDAPVVNPDPERQQRLRWLVENTIHPSVSPRQAADIPPGPRCTTIIGPTPLYRVPTPAEASVISRDALSAPPCQTLVLGTTAAIGGLPGDLTEVTASLATVHEGQQDLPPVPNGQRRVAFRLHVRNVGAFTMQLPFIWVWGATHERGWILPTGPTDETSRLRPDEGGDQFVTFDVDKNTRFARLRLGLEPTIVDWLIG